MTESINKAIIKRVVEDGWNGGNSTVLDECYDATCVFHQEDGGTLHGIANIHAWTDVIRTAFPDFYYTIETIHAEEGKVATRYTVRGTNTGSFRGLPPTHRSFEVTGHFIHRIAQNKIVESWGSWDVIGLLQQLGLVSRLVIGDQLRRLIHSSSRKGDLSMIDSERRNSAAVLRFYDEVVNHRQLDIIDDLVGPDFLLHAEALFGETLDMDALTARLRAVETGYPDSVTTVEDLVSEGDLVTCRLSWQGTHTGQFLRVPPTGKASSWHGISTYRFDASGIIVEQWENMDLTAQLRDLGILPTVSMEPGGLE